MASVDAYPRGQLSLGAGELRTATNVEIYLQKAGSECTWSVETIVADVGIERDYIHALTKRGAKPLQVRIRVWTGGESLSVIGTATAAKKGRRTEEGVVWTLTGVGVLQQPESEPEAGGGKGERQLATHLASAALRALLEVTEKPSDYPEVMVDAALDVVDRIRELLGEA